VLSITVTCYSWAPSTSEYFDHMWRHLRIATRHYFTAAEIKNEFLPVLNAANVPPRCWYGTAAPRLHRKSRGRLIWVNFHEESARLKKRKLTNEQAGERRRNFMYMHLIEYQRSAPYTYPKIAKLIQRLV